MPSREETHRQQYAAFDWLGRSRCEIDPWITCRSRSEISAVRMITPKARCALVSAERGRLQTTLLTGRWVAILRRRS